jgi:hypothetical protein
MNVMNIRFVSPLESAVLGVLVGSLFLEPPGRSFTVREIVNDLRNRGFAPNRTTYQSVYTGLSACINYGWVTRHRDPHSSGLWQYRVSDSMRETLQPDGHLTGEVTNG